jgi:hypothetical protein
MKRRKSAGRSIVSEYGRTKKWWTKIRPLPQGKDRYRTDQIRGIVLEISKLAIGYAIV